MEFSLETKRRIFSVGLVVVFLVLLGRFAYVQLYLGKQYFRESEKNRARVRVIDPPRGLIRDRYNEILVDNRPAYTVYVVPAEIKKSDTAYEILATALHTSVEDIRQRIAKNKRGNFVPVKIARQLDFASFSLLHERRLELPGIEFRAESRRAYSSGVMAPHLFGYLGEITDTELQEHGETYDLGDLIGKKGIEQQYEMILLGYKGRQYLEVDALGRVVRDLTRTDNPLFRWIPPAPGKDIILGLDASLQLMLEKELDGRKGGAVVLNCKNGEVLALVSKPDFDLEIFSKPIAPAAWQQLVNDPGKPLYDRMVQSVFPAGSTFKLVLALAGLQTGLIDPQEKVYCPGYYRLGIRNFDCWRAGGHGSVNLLQAIEQSCNVYFFHMSLKVGLDNWARFARLFGFGKTTGIDLSEESAGLVPDEAYLDQRYGRGRWSRGLILNLAVGQGDLLVTPLQMACFAMALANEGHSFRPRVRRGVVNPFTMETEYDNPDSVRIEGIDPEHYALVKQGMYRVVNGAHGTGRAAWVKGIVIAGKTGTAENPHGDAHAWFIGFAPFEDPQIAFCVFIENGGSGGAVAAPVGRKIVSLLLNQKKLVSHPERVVLSK